MTALDLSQAASIAEAVDSCPGVVRRSPSTGTYGVRRRVDGVRRDEQGRIEICIVASPFGRLPELASGVRDAVRTVLAAPVDILIEDIEVRADAY